MPKPDIHPTWYPEAKVICNGQVVMTVGSTQPEIHVDVWSGNHPFYTGTQKIVDTGHETSHKDTLHYSKEIIKNSRWRHSCHRRCATAKICLIHDLGEPRPVPYRGP